MAEEEDIKEYRWETGYEKTWEDLKAPDDQLSEISVSEIIQRAKRKRQADRKKNIKLGMVRDLFILIDSSEAMSNQDLKPTRHLCTIEFLCEFIEEYFDQNPISQLGLIILRNKRAEKITDLGGNTRKHIKALRNLSNTPLVGELSLKNGLDLALDIMKELPSHANKEILVILGSLITCDPGDITPTIDNLKTEGVRCSVISLTADVLVTRQITVETGGSYGVILDASHYKDQLFQHIYPPPASRCLGSSLIKMGFSHQLPTERKEKPLTMCMCHIESTDEASKLTTAGYYCPQCCSKYCELPVECRVCGLTLVLAPHLARSYHHLFPVDPYQELTRDNAQTEICYACQKPFTEEDNYVYKCGSCNRIFCIDCDIFVHEKLHSCPGCSTLTKPVHENSSENLNDTNHVN